MMDQLIEGGIRPTYALLLAIFLSPLAFAIRNVYFHPLSKHPGPRLWAAFRLPYCYSLWRGTLVQDIHAIHKRYGHFVRVAPNEISVAHGDGWNDIYCRRPGHLPFPKNPIWWGELPDRAPSIVSAPTEKSHNRMRHLLEHCFSEKALAAQEGTVNLHVTKMMDQLRARCEKHASKTTVINIVEWFSFVIFDITGDLGFAESFHCLENESMHPWVAELFTYGKVGALVAALRHYMILFKLFMRSIPKATLEASRANFNWGVEKTHRRLNMEVQREDWMKQILANSDEKKDLVLSVKELESNMNVMIFAGSDTCATVLSGTANYLLRTPRALERLVHEVRSSFQSPLEMTFERLLKLPYLNAVVEEGLRMAPPNPSGLQHIAPEGGDSVMGHWLPEGTHVAVHQQSLYRSPEYFHDPDNFWPERWLASARADEKSPFYHDHLDAVQSFSTGMWSCIGKNLGLAELRGVIANLVWHFDIADAPAGRTVEWLDQKSYAMMEKQPLDVQITYVGKE